MTEKGLFTKESQALTEKEKFDFAIFHFSSALNLLEKFKSDIDAFAEESIYANAVVHMLQKGGEAVVDISQRIKSQTPQIPWNEIREMRNEFAHAYSGEEFLVAWNVRKSIPRTERRSQSVIPALLKWIGNKQRFAETIISYMPAKFNSYYEPFLGSGAVMAALLQADSTMMFPHFNVAYGSDILPFLIDVFLEVKTAPEGLIEYYNLAIEEYYKKPKEQYEIIRQRFNTDHDARDFVLLSRTCYSGIIRFRKADGYMSTPVGPHKPISPDTFRKRVMQWHDLLQKASFETISFKTAMDRPQDGDVVYCDPPYTHSQRIIYGAQDFDINVLWEKIAECKARGAKILLSINGMRESQNKDISAVIPNGIFERKIIVDCGTSMIDRLQNTGKTMIDEKVDDLLLLTW